MSFDAKALLDADPENQQSDADIKEFNRFALRDFGVMLRVGTGASYLDPKCEVLALPQDGKGLEFEVWNGANDFSLDMGDAYTFLLHNAMMDFASQHAWNDDITVEGLELAAKALELEAAYLRELASSGNYITAAESGKRNAALWADKEASP